MWRVFEKFPGNKADLHCVPSKLTAQTMGAYRGLGDRCGLKDQENLITMLPFGVTGVGTQLIGDVIMTESASETAGRM